MFAASPSPTMESTKVGAPPKAARPPLWRRPKAASIVGDGEAANIAKTYAYTYQMCPYFHICHLSYYSTYVSSVEIGYSPTTSMLKYEFIFETTFSQYYLGMLQNCC